MAKILLVTDAWMPQINGVVTTLTNIVKQAEKHGDEITVYHPQLFKYNLPKSQYPQPNVVFWQQKKHIDFKKYDHIYIATPETYLGFRSVRSCTYKNIKFITGYHTKFPEYLQTRYQIPKDIGWRWMRYVHKNSKCILTTTVSMQEELRQNGFFQNISVSTRGIDRSIFYPDHTAKVIAGRPILINVGRVSVEKGLDDFCQIKYGNRATKVVIGDGPYRQELQRKYPDVLFTGMLQGKELADWYRLADCFVFTSINDTFGVVMLESIACGTPVAAYPVTGPIDIITEGITGSCDWYLETAIKKCLDIDRNIVYNESLDYSWQDCYKNFKTTLVET